MSTNTSSDRAYDSFLVEAPELLQQIEQDLFSLRQECSPNKVHNLMRATHTLKGAAASVGLETLKQVAHFLEDVLMALYHPSVAIDAQIEELLFQFYECLRLPVSAEITHAVWDESEVLARAAAVFDQLQVKLGCFGQDAQLPTAAELGVDMTRSIFERDVGDRLAVLAEAIAQSETARVAETLQQQATVFLGLAEALDLPSFGAIAQTALASLNAFPDQAVTIAQLALTDWQQVRSAVLAESKEKRAEGAVISDQLSVTSVETLHVTSVQSDQLSRTTHHDAASLRRATAQPPASPRNYPLPITHYPLPEIHTALTPSSQIVRVEWEKLEQLNDLSTDLLVQQVQQAAIDRQSQARLRGLQQQLQQHQQTLDRLWNWSQKLLVQSDGRRASAVSKTEIMARNHWMRLFQSLRTETMQLAVATGEVTVFNQECSQISARQQQLLAHMHSDLMQARTSPIGDVFGRLQRVLEQLVAVYGKPTQLQQSGTDILVDKAIADRLYEILLHLIRNAFDHGIESPAVRRQLGKPQVGQIRLAACQQEQWTTIEVSDDGKGLDWEKTIERALAMNLLTWEQTMSMSQTELSNVLFAPGFSTATQVNDLSGRGLGLDVVRTQLQLLQGEVTLESKPQKGTTFTIWLPRTLKTDTLSTANGQLGTQLQGTQLQGTQLQLLTEDRSSNRATQQLKLEDFAHWHFPGASPLEWKLNTNSLFIWQAGTTIFILPYTNIAEYVVPQPEQIVRDEQQRFLTWHGQRLPLYSLTQWLKYNHPVGSTVKLVEERTRLTLVIARGDRTFAVESTMQRLVTETEIAIAPCDRAIAFPSYIGGCTVWENRRLLLVIDLMSLLTEKESGGASTLWGCPPL